MAKKIIRLKEDLGDDSFEAIAFDVLVYWYENYGYEGSGVAIWRNNGKWSYSGLSHCSCYGPTENLLQDSKMGVTLDNLKSILSNWNGGDEVLEYINKKRYV